MRNRACENDNGPRPAPEKAGLFFYFCTMKKSLTILVGSTNPVKINSVKRAFDALFPGYEIVCSGHPVHSGVPDQPVGDQETLKGARNRAAGLQSLFTGADYWVGIEGGIVWQEERMLAMAWICILNNAPEAVGKAKEGIARSASFLIPKEVSDLVKEGVELGLANDRIFHTHSSKSGAGAIGILTHNLIDRTELYRPAVIMAMIPYL